MNNCYIGSCIKSLVRFLWVCFKMFLLYLDSITKLADFYPHPGLYFILKLTMTLSSSRVLVSGQWREVESGRGKGERGKLFAFSPYPSPSVFFLAYFSLYRLHYANAWNRLRSLELVPFNLPCWYKHEVVIKWLFLNSSYCNNQHAASIIFSFLK